MENSNPKQNPFSYFPLVDVPEAPPPTPEEILGYISPVLRKSHEFIASLMVRPADMTARHLGETVWYAHEAIGGGPALAEWAAQNRTKFYTTLFARMLPQANSPILQDQREVRFRLAVPVKALDITDVEDLQTPHPPTMEEPYHPQEPPHA